VENAPIHISRLEKQTILLVIIAGLIWGLFNTALAMIFSFGISVLMADGWTITSGGFIISLVLWLTILTVPLGGFAADRIRGKALFITISTIGAAALMFSASRTANPVPYLIGLGLVCGLPAGAMMALPASVLKPQNRSGGMAVFFTLFYLAMSIGPIIAGRLAGYTGRAATALDFGAALLVACPVLLALFVTLRDSMMANEIIV
jgi:MFS family permease